MSESGNEQIEVGRNSFEPIENSTHTLARWAGTLLNLIGQETPQFVHGGILYWKGITTSILDNSKSIPLREARAEAFNKILNSYNKNEKRKIIREEHKRKRLTQELYDHHLIEVETSNGRLGGQVSILNPHAEGIPIVVILGSSNDPESMESALVSLGMQTEQKIIAFGYPCAPNGKISKDFAKAVKKDTKQAQKSFRKDPKNGQPPSYAPYAEFFDALLQHPDISAHLQNDENFDLWSYSGGAAIAAKLCAKYQNRINNAVFLNPAGSATFSIDSDREFEQNMAKQGKLTFAEGKKYFRYTWWDDPRLPLLSKDKRLKFSTWQNLGRGTHYRIPEWDTVKTKGNILVFSGGMDYATMSRSTFSDENKPDNDAIHVLYEPEAHHITLLAFPDETIESILNFQHQLVKATQPVS